MQLNKYNLTFSRILKEDKFYLTFIYIFVVIGFTFSLFFKPKLNSFCMLIVLCIILPYSCLFLDRAYVLIFKDNLPSNKFINLYLTVAKISFVLLPFLLGFYFNINNSLELDIATFLTTMFISLIFSLVYVKQIKQRFFHNEASELEFILTIISLVFVIIYYLDDKILIYCANILKGLLINLSDYLTVSLAIVALCATFSVLTFTYCMILSDDSMIKKDMKKNGEYFFISTILASIFIVILIFSSFLLSEITIINFTVINFYTLVTFIGGNMVAFSLICSVVIFYYIIKYLVIGCFSSIKLLKQELNI